VQGVQYVRARGRFNPDTSFGISGALHLPDGPKAQAAASGLQNISKSFTIMAMLKIIGIDPLVRNMTVTPSGNDVQFTTVIDEKNLRGLLKLLTDWATSGAVPNIPHRAAGRAAAPRSEAGLGAVHKQSRLI